MNRSDVAALVQSMTFPLGVEDQALVLAVIEAESSFDANAYRAEPSIGDASRGLGQLLLRTARKLGFTGPETALFDPATNVGLTISYLRQLQSVLDTPAAAVSAYNCGLRDINGHHVDVPSEGMGPFRSACWSANSQRFSNTPYVDQVFGYQTRWLRELTPAPSSWPVASQGADYAPAAAEAGYLDQVKGPGWSSVVVVAACVVVALYFISWVVE